MMATQFTQVAFVERYGTAIVLDLLALDELISHGSRLPAGTPFSVSFDVDPVMSELLAEVRRGLGGR